MSSPRSQPNRTPKIQARPTSEAVSRRTKLTHCLHRDEKQLQGWHLSNLTNMVGSGTDFCRGSKIVTPLEKCYRSLYRRGCQLCIKWTLSDSSSGGLWFESQQKTDSPWCSLRIYGEMSGWIVQFYWGGRANIFILGPIRDNSSNRGSQKLVRKILCLNTVKWRLSLLTDWKNFLREGKAR
jgi:hypothetical protein